MQLCTMNFNDNLTYPLLQLDANVSFRVIVECAVNNMLFLTLTNDKSITKSVAYSDILEGICCIFEV